MRAPLSDADRSRVVAWWAIWAGLLVSLVAIYFALVSGRPRPAAAPNPFVDLIGLVPLFLSIVIRWLVLPRYHEGRRALPVFVVGLALADACGIIGMFLGGPYRDDFFVLGTLAILQFVPFYARRLYEPRPPTGFVPNN
jgi:F0F1-type ATP synthase membrane subunit c/vacuolar-type H+-ATPase subunit K